MSALETLALSISECAKDVRLNLGAVLQDGPALDAGQRCGVALALACATGDAELVRALASEARTRAGEPVVEDALAAAALMAMNNVYYRFRHRVENPAYARRSPQLRMNRLTQPATSKADFELFALAVSAYNDCETCIRAHERAVLAGGLGEDHVHEAVRIAAVVAAAATARAAAHASSTPTLENPS